MSKYILKIMLKVMINRIYMSSVILILLLFTQERLYSQSSNQNYVVTETMLDESGRSVKSVQYYDGLGRPTVLAAGGVNTKGNYVYSMLEYDMLDRECKTWQPAVGGTAPGIISVNDIVSLSKSTYSDNHAFGEMKYDALGRQTFKSTSGDSWSGKGVKTEYLTNDSTCHKVRRYTLKNGLPDNSVANYYEQGSLSCIKTTDEDGHTIEVYKDFLGNVVLERRNGNNDTYYVYEKNLLRMVIPPLYQTQKLSTLLYKYEYDNYNHCVKKTLPGGVIIKYWYDKYDRVSFMQDGRLTGTKQFRFYLYDGLGRTVVQGLTKDTVGKSDCKKYIATANYDKGSASVASTGYKMSTSATIDNPAIEIVNYYDGYGCLSLASFSKIKSNVSIDKNICTTSLQTAQYVATSDGGNVLRMMLYDEKGRCNSSYTTYPDGKCVNTITTYSFTDKPTLIQKIIHNFAKQPDIIRHEFTYDTISDLLLKETLAFNSNPKVTLYENSYNGIGQVKSVNIGSGKMSTDYSYDVHGWTKSINSVLNSNNKLLFNESLYYADGSGRKCYNGNISEVRWISGDYPMGTDIFNGYKYYYDGMDRLTAATYTYGHKVLSTSSPTLIKVM